MATDRFGDLQCHWYVVVDGRLRMPPHASVQQEIEVVRIKRSYAINASAANPPHEEAAILKPEEGTFAGDASSLFKPKVKEETARPETGKTGTLFKHLEIDKINKEKEEF